MEYLQKEKKIFMNKFHGKFEIFGQKLFPTMKIYFLHYGNCSSLIVIPSFYFLTIFSIHICSG